MKKLLLIAALALPMTPLFADAPKPEALVADGLPSIPDELPLHTRPYMEFRSASFAGWHPTDKSMLVATRFANTHTLQTFSVGERGYVLASGSDDGLTLFAMLPGGRLLALSTLADTEAMALANISAITARTTSDGTTIYAA